MAKGKKKKFKERHKSPRPESLRHSVAKRILNDIPAAAKLIALMRIEEWRAPIGAAQSCPFPFSFFFVLSRGHSRVSVPLYNIVRRENSATFDNAAEIFPKNELGLHSTPPNSSESQLANKEAISQLKWSVEGRTGQRENREAGPREPRQ